MRKIIFSFLAILFLAQVLYADNNGIWVDAKDIRAGTFGSDESSGNFVFPNNLNVGNTFQASQARVSGNLGYWHFISTR